MKNKTFLAIIPAREGSKRLPNKNIKNLNGKPLIYYSISASLKSKYITETVVSTDSTEIRELANKFGASTPFLRPKELSQDKSSSIEVVIHCVNYYKEVLNKEFDYVILLQPTSPLRDEVDLDSAIEFLLKKSADAVVSVTEVEHNPIWSNVLDDSNSMENFLDKKYLNKRSQDLPKYYRLNGAIYICNTSKLIEENTFFISKNIFAFRMLQEKSIDIDTKIDFIIANSLMSFK